jgi:hypothetical protein
MTDRDPKLSRTLLSMQDLRWRALAEIRKQPGCSDVQGIAINRVTDERAENNWSLIATQGHQINTTNREPPLIAPRSFTENARWTIFRSNSPSRKSQDVRTARR